MWLLLMYFTPKHLHSYSADNAHPAQLNHVPLLKANCRRLLGNMRINSRVELKLYSQLEETHKLVILWWIKLAAAVLKKKIIQINK